MNNPAEILTTITLAVSGWTLIKVIRQGEVLAALQQKLKDLPCNNCEK
jgi:hypothetical protein